jgi:amidase
MIMSQDIHYLGLLEVSAKIRSRELSAEHVTATLLDRIDHHDRRLNSVLLTLAESALAQARQADDEIDRGFWRGPLHGVPLGVKDSLWTEGVPTTSGMEVLSNFRPAENSTVVKRMLDAGAVLIGKLHMTEGATLEHHEAFGRPYNPWSEDHWTGVSSSGSGVAVAAGLCYGSLGTDTSGSIRMPSAANNLTGIKPTWGRVSRHGLVALSETLDHIGPMARSTADAAAILQVIAGADRNDPTALHDPVPDYSSGLDASLDGVTLGIDRDFAYRDMPAEIVGAMEDAVAVLCGLGVRLREVECPRFDWRQTSAIISAEAAGAHAEYFPAQADRYGAHVRAVLEAGAAWDAPALARAYLERARFAGRLAVMFEDVDLLILPGIGGLLPKWRDVEAGGDTVERLRDTIFRFNGPFNQAGVPTISLPAGFHGNLPIGIQLVGRRLAEPLLIRAGHGFQQRTDFHTRHPDLN